MTSMERTSNLTVAAEYNIWVLSQTKELVSFSDPDNSVQGIEEPPNSDIELKGLLPDSSVLPEDEEDEEFELTVHGQSS